MWVCKNHTNGNDLMKRLMKISSSKILSKKHSDVHSGEVNQVCQNIENVPNRPSDLNKGTYNKTFFSQTIESEKLKPL